MSGARGERTSAERRWPMAAAVLTAVVLQLITPRLGRVPFWWVAPIIELVLLALIVVEDPGRIDRRTRMSRGLRLALNSVMTFGTAAALVILMHQILNPIEGLTAKILLARGASLWVTNVIVFSLWFWDMDRGGPAERAARSGIPASFVFPEDALPDAASKGWLPRYQDYLYLSFTNATAFSPTDTLPVKTWAKMTMMLESAISLVTAILVVARAINLLPG